MKKIPFIFTLLLLVSVFLSACKVNTATTATVPETETQVTAPTTSSVMPTPAAPTVVLPTQDTRLKDDQGKMICTIYPAMFSGEMSDQEKHLLKIFPPLRMLTGKWGLKIRC